MFYNGGYRFSHERIYRSFYYYKQGHDVGERDMTCSLGSGQEMD